jgi:hypothetical protein
MPGSHLFAVIALVTFGEEYKSWRSSICSRLQPHLTPPLTSKYIPQLLFLAHPPPVFFPVTDQVPLQYKATGKIIRCIFWLLCCKMTNRKTKRFLTKFQQELSDQPALNFLSHAILSSYWRSRRAELCTCQRTSSRKNTRVFKDCCALYEKRIIANLSEDEVLKWKSI